MAAEPQSLPATGAPARPLLRNWTYLAVLMAHFISIIGDGFHSVALGFWVLQTTGSGTAMATVMAIKTVVQVALSPIAGTLADRVDRRKLMIGMDLARFVLVGLMVPLILQPHVPFAVLVMLAGLIAACGAFMSPAFSASLVNIVGKEQLDQATGLNQALWTGAQILGPLAGGAVYATWGGGVSLSFDAASYLVSALLILIGGHFASPRTMGTERSSFWGDLVEGLRVMRGDGLIRSILVLAPVINFFGNAMGVLIPVLAIKVWLVSPQQFGMLEGAFPFGFLMGAAAIMALQAKLRRRGYWMGGSLGLAGLIIAVVGLANGFIIALPLTVIMGVCLAFTNLLLQVTLQKETPPELQGRVFGTLNAVAQAIAPIGMMAAGALTDVIRPGYLMTGCGLAIAMIAAVGWAVLAPLRRYN
jgi:DHA3 family macrolide efflux protein-like MFS transporter